MTSVNVELVDASLLNDRARVLQHAPCELLDIIEEFRDLGYHMICMCAKQYVLSHPHVEAWIRIGRTVSLYELEKRPWLVAQIHLGLLQKAAKAISNKIRRELMPLLVELRSGD